MQKFGDLQVSKNVNLEVREGEKLVIIGHFALYAALEEQSFFGKLKVLKYDSEDYEGYAYIKIYNHNAEKQNMTDYLTQKLSVENIVTFGSIDGKYTHTIDRGDSNQVVRFIKKEFEPVKKPKRNIFM